MIIIGIDPGYAIVGYGVIRAQSGRYQPLDFGAITTPAGMEFGQRLMRIYEETKLLLAKCRPEAMSLERLYFQTNKTTAIGVAEARGVILLAAQQSGVPVFEYTPLQIKQAEMTDDVALLKLQQHSHRPSHAPSNRLRPQP